MRYSKLLAVLILSMCFWGCVTDSDFVELQGRVINIESRLDTIEREMKKIEEVLNIQQKQKTGTLYDSIKSLESEIYSMRSDIDSNTADIVDIKKRLADLEVELMEIKKLLAKSTVKTTTQVTESTSISPEKLYETGVNLVKEGKYQEAVKQLQEFLQKYPEHKLASNAFYWIGEAYYGMGKYREAILQFEDYRRKFPDGVKIPSSILKEALAFLKIEDKNAARILLNKLIKDYPKTPEAEKAKEILSSLK